jgi:hypothetical protein
MRAAATSVTQMGDAQKKRGHLLQRQRATRTSPAPTPLPMVRTEL